MSKDTTLTLPTKTSTTKESNSAFSMNKLNEFFKEVGELTRFGGNFFKSVVKPPYEFKELMKQCFLIGYQSLSLVAITGFIMGLVLTIQTRPTLARFGAESWIPGMIAVSIVREIGPVITALICAGKVGSGIGAELASMKVTEQIDAMEVSGTNPFKYIVVTRILATTLMIPILVVFADFVSFIGGYLGVNILGDVGLRFFFTQIFDKLGYNDLLPAMFKTIFFGFSIGLVSTFKGYNATKGTEGVGLSANAAVVLSSLCIFIIDAIAVQLTSLLVK
jgi:phospholipid/cholesterol/gamma-HCH transport system permease protein